jgi:hypothetical protein
MYPVVVGLWREQGVQMIDDAREVWRFRLGYLTVV